MTGFKDVVGRKDLVSYIQKAVTQKQISHAYILNGERGSGKKMFAQLFAMTLQCERGGAEPCNECHSCRQALSGNHPDIIRVVHEKTNTISVEEVRVQINNDIMIRPYNGKYKIYIVPDADMMTVQAQNALLKVFEEPPERVMFILTVTSAVKLLPTVRSRAQIFTLEGEEQPSDTDLALTAAISQAIPASGEVMLLELTAPLIKDKERFRRVLQQLALLFRDACVLRAGGTSCLSHQPEDAEALAHALTRGQLMRLLEYVQGAQKAQNQNANAALLVTTFCARIRTAAHGRNV